MHDIDIEDMRFSIFMLHSKFKVKNKNQKL